MLNGLWKLTWVETKVFVREPMGVVGSLAIPVVMFLVLGRIMGSPSGTVPAASWPFNVAILAAIIIAIGAVLSLISIIAIYREGGILKRLRATPLSPLTILGAHVLVKLLFTVVGMALLVGAGRRFFPGAMQVNLLGFTAALLLSTLSILSLGFVLASMVRTARFAQPLGAAVLYPMLAVSGLFVPLEQMPRWIQVVAPAFPITHAVALLQGIWDGSGLVAHWVNIVGLIAIFAVCCLVSIRVFRWE